MNIKRSIPAGALLAILAILVTAYIAATSNLSAGFYTPAQQDALLVHGRMNLVQAAPVWNYYMEDGLVDPSSMVGGDTRLLANLGARECRVRAALEARYQEVEGVATTAYDLDFEGAYLLRHAGLTSTVELIFPFPTGLDTLNQVTFLVDGVEPPGVEYRLSGITWWTELKDGEEHEIVVRYRARGVESFRYALDHDRRLEELDVEIAVRGLAGSQVPDDSLPTTAVESAADGERFAWRYEALIADRDVQVSLPTRPGFAQRVEALQEPLRALSLASPFLVALFVGCLAGAQRLSGVRLPTSHTLLAGLGFFLFYPGLTFLCGVVELAVAAALAAAVVTLFLLLFLARAAGWRRTGWQTALLCVIFLGLFSLGAMSHLRGLLITAGGLALVGMFMLLVARRGAKPETREQEPGEAQEDAFGSGEAAEQVEDVEPAEEVGEEEKSPARFCPHCGRPLDEGFAFCPGCGHDASGFRVCPQCGSEHYLPPGTALKHCPACGAQAPGLAGEDAE